MSYTLLLLTAYAIVRTVPSAIGQIGGKKIDRLLAEAKAPVDGPAAFTRNDADPARKTKPPTHRPNDETSGEW